MLTSAVSRCLEDKSPYVRRSAALAVPSLYEIVPTAVTEGDIWDLLYRHLADKDGMTVAACLVALEDVFRHETGVVLSNKLGQYLVKAIPDFSFAVQRVLLQFLLKFSPKSKSQMFEHMNVLDSCLTQSSHLVVSLACLEVFKHFTDDLPKVNLKAYKLAWTTIKKHLPKEKTDELVSALIDYLTLSNFPSSVCEQDYSKFFCRHDDPLYLLNKKIVFLSSLISEKNAECILQGMLSI